MVRPADRFPPRGAVRARTRILSVTLIVVASVCLASCGGGTDSGSAPSPLNIAGNWQFTLVSNSSGGRIATGTGSLSQSASNFSGAFVLTNACSATGSISGTISGASATGTLTENGEAVSLTGTIANNGNSASGTYTSAAGACPNGDSGTWTGTRSADPPLVVTPPLASLTTTETLQLAVNASNATWSVNGIGGGNGAVGLITANGLYAPPSIPGTYTITATANGASANATVAVTNFPGTLSWRTDQGLTGQNSDEVALTPSSMTGGNFGKLFSCAVDGYVYAQPLYVANLNITVGSAVHHNVVFVATENDSVYAFDADVNSNPCRPIWQTNFVANAGGAVDGISTIPSTDAGESDIVPQIGITGTPVINPSNDTLYVVAATKENGAYVHRLHALDITTGNEKPSSPVVIQASVTGSGDGSNQFDQLPFAPLQEDQRPALLFNAGTGTVYVTYGSFDDNQVFHGWLLAYNATTLAQTAVFNTTPNGSSGAVNQGGAGPSLDASGNLYLATGNGTFDVSINGAPYHNDYAQSLLQLGTSAGLAVSNFFTPYNQAGMNSNGTDFGASGVLLLPNAAGTVAIPHLAVVGSQPGVLYLVNRDNLGAYTPGGPDKVLQEITLAGAVYGTPAFWQGSCNGNAENMVYTAASGDGVKAFPVANAALAVSPASQSAESFALPGASPTISSNGAANESGIVWALDTSGYGTPAPAILHAYDACRLTNELYNSSLQSGDAAGDAVKSAVPTVANGKVYVGTQTELSVYGLLP